SKISREEEDQRRRKPENDRNGVHTKNSKKNTGGPTFFGTSDYAGRLLIRRDATVQPLIPLLLSPFFFSFELGFLVFTGVGESVSQIQPKDQIQFIEG
ncbi:hypothetical protein PIB30_081215, partial [Stylosanthes scabra]|nr:hypothetical protein [Stylosanthes scabra]